MTASGHYQTVVDRACSTEPGVEASRKEACDEIASAVYEGNVSILDLAVLLAGPLTSPEKEARENGTRLLGEVVGRCRKVLGEGELHTVAEFLAARLKDWPCVGAAAAACRALLQPPPESDPGTRGASSDGSAGARLGNDSAVLVLEATAEMLRSAQSFRQDDRSALLQLLLAATRGWGRLAAQREVPLLDAFLGAVDGEKDPRCLLLAFEAVRALCEMHHSPGVDAGPLRQLADEVADWASSYFPISFNPPPSLARGGAAITRADLSSALESALAASPFLAGGVLPLLLEKLSSTYRPAKEAALSALALCCPAYGPDAIRPHMGQLWPALRSEVMAPCGHGGAAAVPLGPAAGVGGSEADSRLALATSAASCLTAVLRAAGPGSMDALALQDACVSDLVAVVRAAASPTRGSAAQALSRADGQVLCGSMLLAALSAADPSSLRRTHLAALSEVQTALATSLAPHADGYDSQADQTLYGMTILSAVVDAVAAELCSRRDVEGDGAAAATVRAWAHPDAADGIAALTEVKSALLAALAAVHSRLDPGGHSGALPAAGVGTTEAMAVDSAAPAAAAAAAAEVQPESYSPASAAQLRLAVVGAWLSLLRLHDAAAAAPVAPGAAALPQLMLSAAEMTEAAGQLCACALASAATAAEPPRPARMRWGRREDAASEAAAALQLLLQLQPSAATAPLHPVAAQGALAASEEHTSVVRLLVGRLAAAMAGVDGERAGGGNGAGLRAAALWLAVRLTTAPEEQQRSAAAAASSGRCDAGGAGAAGFAAALLLALPAVLLKQGNGGGGEGDDAEWRRDCLIQLATKVLPALAPAPNRAAASAASGAGPHSPQAESFAVAAAAHALVSAALAAAAQWEAAGSRGLPFGDTPTEYGAATTATTTATHGSLAAGQVSLLPAWSAAVQQLTACCDDWQQLDLAMEAAERIAAAAGARADSQHAPGASAGRQRPAPTTCVSLACAVVAGLRVGVLAAHSTQALAESLLRLLAEPAPSSEPSTSSCGSAVALSTAAVALAAAVNRWRWQDAALLDSWLSSAFRPALLQSLAAVGELVSVPASAATVTEAAPDAAVAAPVVALPSAAAVRAVGWVGRALALRNHPTLQEVVGSLLACLRAEPDAVPASASASAATPTAMEVDSTADLDVEGAPAGFEVGVRYDGAEMAAAAAVAAAAAEAFGVLVAEDATAGGVVLAARGPLAVCRVLWQQRTYSLCAQALEAEHRRQLEQCQQQQSQQQQQQQLPGPICGAPQMPLHMAMAVARLAGCAPRQMCRNDATRLAPLLLRAAQSLCGALRGEPPAAAPSAAAAASRLTLTPTSTSAAAEALREALAVVRDWLGVHSPPLSDKLEQVLREQVGELVDCVVGAVGVSAGAPPARAAVRTAPLALGPTAAGACATAPPAPAVDAALAASVREEALRCCSALVDALPYHVLHPLRQQVLSCVVRALDDNRRSVRQLAVRARRAWADT